MFSQTTRSRPAPSRRQTRCTPLRCDVRGWWPRRCRRVPASPPAPFAPALFAVGYLKGRKEGHSEGVRGGGLSHTVFKIRPSAVNAQKTFILVK